MEKVVQSNLSQEMMLTVKEVVSSPKSPTSHRSDRRHSSSGSICRICHEGENGGNDSSQYRNTGRMSGEPLISPCDCIGTLGLVHRSCLEHWLSASNLDHCEICKFRFNTQRKSKPFCEWVRNGGGNGAPGSGGLLGDMMCLTLLMPLCLVSVYLCAMAAAVYLRHGVWEGAGLAVLCCFLLLGFVGWCSITFRYHWSMFLRWKMVNQVVHLNLEDRPSSRPIPVSLVALTLQDTPSITMNPADTNNNDGPPAQETTRLFTPRQEAQTYEVSVFM
ncbi:E3 ubiquitin-protein ligase MARCHF2-like [Ischnura elegans]|uniref:E3 ubiquitin-protein ligase MARCHF2-like n=1 Tax=Ischnura elegans TaxID=197161 RepID=UPI001ED875AE|nr:E3 ubiquitin-protein ligase MARCHF2-like [Ischnura elegans]